MIRLLKIELQKVLSYKAFWLMLSFYGIILALMIFGIPGLIDWVAEKSGEPTRFRIFKAIVFNFPDIWQNISFVASMRYFIKIILGLIIIVLITTEFHNLTIRANIINGFSRKDFLAGKIEMIIFLSLFSTAVIFFSGLYLGLFHSSGTTFSRVFSKMGYLVGYFIEIAAYLLFCLLLGIIFKKTGITFIANFIYLMVEPILDYKLPDYITPYLPLNGINGIIRTPNTSLIKLKTPDFNYDFQEAISLLDVGICLGYAALFIFLSYFILKKRDI
jgi:ABC-type transport system involved in multi-copper enzyme maturation permease subunit